MKFLLAGDGVPGWGRRLPEADFSGEVLKEGERGLESSERGCCTEGVGAVRMGGCSGQVRQRHARTCVAVLPTSLPAPKRRQRHVPLRARHTVRPSRALAHSAPIASTTHTAACSALVPSRRQRQVPVRVRHPRHRQDGHGAGGDACHEAQEVCYTALQWRDLDWSLLAGVAAAVLEVMRAMQRKRCAMQWLAAFLAEVVLLCWRSRAPCSARGEQTSYTHVEPTTTAPVSARSVCLLLAPPCLRLLEL